MPCESSHNRGTRGDSSFMLDAMASSSEKPPLQMRSIKWWEYVTGTHGGTEYTIRYAREKGRLVDVINDAGCSEPQDIDASKTVR